MGKRLLIVLALFVCGIAGVWADEIDEKQALKEAKAFLESHRSTSISGGQKMSSNTSLKLQGKVSGLYVFNATDGSGFIIVSNDDQTTPILGFGENGNIDIEKMPDNMRAWLQGYADEIAWLQKNGGKTAKTRANVGTTRNLGSHATTAIEPLVKTTWNQGTPYNNLCPKYDGTNRAVTGCVATAMAQVMKYHEWPKEDTANGKDGFTAVIPGYTTDSYDIDLDELPAIRFDWANMKNTYTGSETDATATAVATLMQYCGYSVEMDYGPSSGSNTDRVAFALKEYFDYNENTTQFVSRSMYTLANWTDLIYNELEQNRPVVYGGMSSGGGHEFVCDGYKYENGTDFFHINWGWGGSNDEYYVLSSLNPYGTQGIGGSSSDDGFHYGQDAVIGIQPSTGTGTVAVIPQNTINLSLVSITSSKESVAPGESVDITVKVQNNGPDVYDGDIMIYEEKGLYDLQGKTYTIAAGETKECVFTITPAATGTYSFVPLRNDFYYFENPQVNKATFTVAVRMPDGLTVYDGTATSQYVPAYIYYFDDYTRSQFVIPAADLVKMEGGTINSISFYTTSNNIPCTTVSKVDVYLKEVENTSISVFETKESSTIVYQGTLTIANITGGGLLTIFLATPYKYNGGNLMIGIDNTTDAGWKQIFFYGQSVSGASIAGTNGQSLANIVGTGTQQNFIPKTTFEYTPATGVANPKPTNIVASLAADGATLTWTGKGDSYNVQYRTTASEEVLFYEDFETGIPNSWTTIDADGDGHNWLALSDVPSVYAYPNVSHWAHSGSDAATSPSYVNYVGAFASDHYLISPKLNLEGTLRFYATSKNATYYDSYEVLLSTTGTDAADFTTTLRAKQEAPYGSWEEVSIDLSKYDGQQGYIAIHHVSEDCYFLVIDDFGLYGSTTPTGSWQDITPVTTTTATLSGLATNNGYEYRIQSVKDGNTSDWSETGEFALLTLQDEADNSSLIYNNTGRLAHVTLSGRTLFKDGYWNTLCLPFSLNATQLASAQMDNADIRTLDNASFSSSTLELNFADKSAITAGTPYIIKWEGDGSNNLQNPVFANVTIDKTMHHVTCNLGEGNAVTFKGTYSKLAYTEDTPSILFLGGESSLYYPKATASIGAQRAYFELTGITAQPASIEGVRAFMLNYGKGTTGIVSLSTESGNQGMADAWYSIDGRKLDSKPTRKGLYIVNGKKVVIK